MKICILTPRFPFPENGGDVLRINNIARYLKGEGHELVLVSFVENGYDMEAARRLYDKIYVVRRKSAESALYSLLYMLGGRPIQCGYYHSPAFSSMLRRVAAQERPDRYVAHLLRMSPYLVDMKVRDRSIVEMTDALSKTYALSSKAGRLSLKKMVYTVERNLICRYESRVTHLFPKVVLVSQSDIDYLKDNTNARGSSLALHTNGVEMFPAEGRGYDSAKICFIGNMRTLQNQDAVLHFVNDILPIIKQKRPDARFYVVGAEPPKCIQQLAEKNKDIVVTGFVDDLYAAVADSCLAVAPVQVAAGIQNKVLVAMSMGVPVVMTPLISRAIPELKNGDNCFVHDTDPDFAESCLRLMDDADLRGRMARAGHKMVGENYSWTEKLRGYDRLDSQKR